MTPPDHSNPRNPALHVLASAACYALLYPALVEAARGHGYALALHGSMTRDCDLIAVPWTDTASEALEMILALKVVCGGVFVHTDFDDLVKDGQPTTKPHGRVDYSIHLTNDGCQGPYLDISVMPRMLAMNESGVALGLCRDKLNEGRNEFRGPWLPPPPLNTEH
jgi:hypothetical protein